MIGLRFEVQFEGRILDFDLNSTFSEDDLDLKAPLKDFSQHSRMINRRIQTKWNFLPAVSQSYSPCHIIYRTSFETRGPTFSTFIRSLTFQF